MYTYHKSLVAEDIPIISDMEEWEKNIVKKVKGVFQRYMEANALLQNVVTEDFQSISKHRSVKKYGYTVTKKEVSKVMNMPKDDSEGHHYGKCGSVLKVSKVLGAT